MKANTCILPGILALFLAPFTLQAAKPAGTPAPSVHLRQLIDGTMRKIDNISNPKQPPLDRTSLSMAQAEYTARLQTAPPAQQPMYQAALNVVNSLVAAVEEHEKAVADFHYSKNVHGKQDREDAKVANWQRGSDAGAAARADNAKQKQENAASRQALLDKEKFMSNGTLALWTQHVGQLHDAVEQTFTTELVAEQKLAMLTPAAPLPPPPAPTPASKPAKQISAAEQYSPVGAWKANQPHHRSATLKEDNTLTGGHDGKTWTGTWKWTDQSKGALTITWSDGLAEDLNFSVDGRTLSGKVSNGNSENWARSTEAAPAASTAAPPAVSPSAPQPRAPSVSGQNSPVGTWKAALPSYRSAILKEDNTVTGGRWAAPWKWSGTWKWTDQSKGALTIDWKDGLKSDLIFSPDGRTMAVKNSNGHETTFTRSTSPPGT